MDRNVFLEVTVACLHFRSSDLFLINHFFCPSRGLADGAIPQTSKGGWRTLQPSELLLGLTLAVSQPVLCRKEKDTWFPGHISSVSCQSNLTKSPESTIYDVTLDAAPGCETEVCRATTASLAVAVSASELKQKYPVGARVVSIYRDDDGGIGYYSGLIAEPPSERNSHRYAIRLSILSDMDTFVTIGTCCSLTMVTRNIHHPMKFIGFVINRPMVRLKPGQSVETELNGEWMQTTVEKVDASLVLIRFSETHREWIYRGSTRLEPLFNDMNSPASRILSGRVQGVEVEYGNIERSPKYVLMHSFRIHLGFSETALTDQSSLADLRSARKSATGNRDPKTIPHLTLQSKSGLDTRTATRRHPGSVNLAELESAGKVVPYLDHLFENIETKPFISHKCNPSCVVYVKPPSTTPVSEDPFSYKGCNPLEIPFHAGWLRYLLVGHPRETERRMIVYRAPCGRQLRSLHEVQRFLDRSNSQLTTDLFCFDPEVLINSEFHAEKTLTNIADISYGKENIPVPCVNSVDNEVPGYIEYIPKRQPIDKVPLVQDSNFVVCCECTDNCRDRSRCACQQLTAEASSLTNPNGMVDPQAGYRYRRLAQFTVGGIYECNSRCRCDRRCNNRVVQHGLWTRVQLFKTSRKGWGIRALHAIPKGTFLCTYAGAIYDENTAVQQGFDYGDEYQAELDYIETVEKQKDGYESMPEDPEEDYSTEQDKPDTKLTKSQSTPSFSDLCEKARHILPTLSRPSSSHTLNELDAESRIDICSDSSSLSDCASPDGGDTDRTNVSGTDLANRKDDPDGSNVSVDVIDSSSKQNTDNTMVSVGLKGTGENSELSQISINDKVPENADVMTHRTSNSRVLTESPEIIRAGEQTSETSSDKVQPTDLEGDLLITESDSVVEENKSLVDPTLSGPLSPNSSTVNLVETSEVEFTPSPLSAENLKSLKILAMTPNATASSNVQDSSTCLPGSSASNVVKRSPIDCEPSTAENVAQSIHTSDSEKFDPQDDNTAIEQSTSTSAKRLNGKDSQDEKEPVSESGKLRIERTEFRPKRTCVKARSQSVPAEFWSLQNARHLLTMLDFDRVPFVRLSPIKTGLYNLPELESQSKAPSELYPDDRSMPKVTPDTSTEDSAPNFKSNSAADGNAVPVVSLRSRSRRHNNDRLDDNVCSSQLRHSSRLSRSDGTENQEKLNIAVGEEMTWDYGYTVGAVPFKVLYCYCGEPNCRIRLL
ncbi:Histone-lysine N-methyltransferase eggless [Fasciola gigantica]|uniref:Histone-lysine N-methyltransferase eggless n=1 Tax=Fasciola gigantica TaxID=46835 RepID=A0A504YZH7_FASGI|nr:Histone-lysine N-methyltransferase eggless [Fasciola gigantica]